MKAAKLVFLPLFIAICTASKIQLNNNGYDDIVVAFSPNMSPSEGLIPKIKDLFTRASSVLYRATRNRAYFRQVTILIPHEWPKSSEYQTATFETFDDADIRIDSPNPAYGDGPYTLQTKSCGEPGRYIHLTPGFVSNYLNSDYLELFGDPGKTLVHEWAHLRWGVFDEFGIPDDASYPTYYFREKVIPNVCSNRETEGIYWDMNKDAPCDYDDSGKPNSTCRFIPSVDNKGSSSLTSIHKMPLVSTFCDDSDDYKHNSDAPNKQNKMCNGRSAWDVITSTEDFKNNKNPPKDISNFLPNFRVVQKREVGTEFVFVLDVSGSMFGEKIKLLHDIAVRWLKYELKFENAVGIVKFSSGASIEQPVIKVSNDAQRNQVINRVPYVADGGTCIRCGLHKGLEALRAYNGGKGGGVIILLTDGLDGDDYVEGVRADVQRDKVKIITIAFTESADSKIEQLAAITDGKAFFVKMNSPKEMLNQAFYEVGTLQTVSSSFSFALKLNEKRFVGSGNEFKGEFVIDSTVGKNTTVDFTYMTRSHVKDITITGPSTSVSLSRGNVIDDISSGLIRFSFQELPVGKYNFVIFTTGASNQEYIVTTASAPRQPNVEPIRTNCRVEVGVNRFTGARTIVTVTAEVKQGQHPVILASVVAKVDRPDGSFILVNLLDNGNGEPDTTANDGIYTRYFPDLISRGRYAVQAQVTDGGKALIQHGFTASPSMAMASKLPIPNQSTAPPRPTGEFQREAVAGSFQIEANIKPNEDMFPPSPIKDLEVVMADPRNASIILRWTSPGDDLDQGTVSGYDLRFSRETNTLKANFDKSTRISMASFKPLPGGNVATFEFDIPKFTSGYTYYFALKSVDKAGHWSQISNTAQTYIRLVRRAVCKA